VKTQSESDLHLKFQRWAPALTKTQPPPVSEP